MKMTLTVCVVDLRPLYVTQKAGCFRLISIKIQNSAVIGENDFGVAILAKVTSRLE